MSVHKKGQFSVSVIIPTYRRVDALRQTMLSLAEQDHDNFEVLVVDNAGEIPVCECVEDFPKRDNIRFRYIQHLVGGASGARNRGVRETTGDLLLFTDDDLDFDPGWISAYQSRFDEHPAMIAAGGLVKPKWESPPPDWLLKYMGDREFFAIFSLMDRGPDFLLGNDGYFFSCNMAIRRAVFDRTGFHPDLFGSRLVGDGETGLQEDIKTSGGLIGYVPEASCFHRIPPAKLTKSFIRKWSQYDCATHYYPYWRSHRRDFPSIAREALNVAKSAWRCWLKDPLVAHRNDPEAIWTQYQSSRALHRLTYLWWMLSDPVVRAALEISDFRP